MGYTTEEGRTQILDDAAAAGEDLDDEPAAAARSNPPTVSRNPRTFDGPAAVAAPAAAVTVPAEAALLSCRAA